MSHTVAMIATGGEVTIAAGEEVEGQAPGPPSFAALAYSGGKVPGYTATPALSHDYVIDLTGTKHTKNGYANLDHKQTQRVGHLTKVDISNQIHVEGLLSAATPFSDQVANSVRNGMPWEVSIEGQLSGRQFVPEGSSVVVNGQTFEGPIYRFTKNTFTDIAFVSRGADGGNQVKIAASTAGETQMTEFDTFIVSCGQDPETIEAPHRANLQKAFDAMKGKTPEHSESTSFVQAAENVRQENGRQDAIQKMALKSMGEYPIYHQQIKDLATAALASGTSVKDFELELLRNTRIQAGAFTTATRAETDPDVMEAAIALSAGLPDIEKHYSEQTLNAVDKSGMRNFGLQQMLMRVAASNGYTCRAGERIHNGNIREVLEYCFPPVHARLGAFSGVDTAGILGNVANKEILSGYMEEDSTWREISTIRSVQNFQQYTSYRMLDSLEYEEIGAGGEIKHGTLGQESYTRQAKTYAKMLGITRTDIINDDLGAFDDIRARLGRGAAKKFNNIFWAAFMNNASFFTSGLTNYISGATTNLGLDGVGLGLGLTGYRKMTSPTADGTKRVGASVSRPTILLAPPELEVNARTLYVSGNFATGASATIASSNIFQNLYRPVIQNRLSDSAFTGNSTTAWYLFGEELKPMVVSFLNGQQTPTVESADADFNTLGIQFRGVHDFGADKSEYLAGIKSKGAS